MKIKKLLTIISVIMSLAVYILPSYALGHGGGQSMEKVVGEYLATLEYEELLFLEGEPTRFDFELVNNATKESIEFTDVWVKVTEGTKALFIAPIAKPGFGNIGMTYTFPVAGEYELNLRFQNKDTSIAEISFLLKVEANEANTEKKTAALFVGWAGGGLIGLIIGFFISFFMKKSNQFIMIKKL